MQFEVVIYIVAQTIPLLRVLFVGSVSTRPGSIAETSPDDKGKAEAKQPGHASEQAHGTHESHELVVLATGKVVLADSKEGKAFRAAPRSAPTAPETSDPADARDARTIPDVADDREGAARVDDETHRLWADMGLSRRAWSKSPTPSPEGRPG